MRVLPIAIRVPLRMGSSSHGGERKGQLGLGETIPMSGIPPEGYPEGSRRVWTPQFVSMQKREKRWEQLQKIGEEFLKADFRRREQRWEQILKQRDEEWKEET